MDTDPRDLSVGALMAPRTIDEFGGWVSPHLDAMSNLAARLVGPADRDDVVQESLARAWQRRETYRAERGTPRVWLLAIVADRARRHLRGRARGQDRLLHVPVVAAVDPDVDLEAAILRLSRRQRLAIELHYFTDLKVADMALVMDCSEGTVKSTLSDARARLHSQLEGK